MKENTEEDEDDDDDENKKFQQDRVFSCLYIRTNIMLDFNRAPNIRS